VKHASKLSMATLPTHLHSLACKCSNTHKNTKYMYFARFQTSTMVYLRSSLFWDVTQHTLVIGYLCCRTAYQSHLQGSSIPSSPVFLTLEDGMDRLSQNISDELPNRTAKTSCVYLLLYLETGQFSILTRLRARQMN